VKAVGSIEDNFFSRFGERGLVEGGFGLGGRGSGRGRGGLEVAVEIGVYHSLSLPRWTAVRILVNRQTVLIFLASLIDGGGEREIL